MDTDELMLPSAADFLGELLDLADPPVLPDGEPGAYLHTLELGMPVELDLERTDSNRLALRMSPPTQTTQTSVFPVLHRLTLRMTVDEHA